MAEKPNEGRKRVWVSDETHALILKMCSRELRPIGKQLDVIVKEAYQKVRDEDKAKRARRRKCKV